MIRLTRKLSRVKPVLLTSKLLNQELSNLPPGWIYNESSKSIKKNFKFKNFSQAFSYLTRVAMQAEKKFHHPEIYNCYNKVELCYTTHEAGGLSMLDFEMARF